MAWEVHTIHLKNENKQEYNLESNAETDCSEIMQFLSLEVFYKLPGKKTRLNDLALRLAPPTSNQLFIASQNKLS